MTDRIQCLTEEQEQNLPVFREEWLQHGLSVDPTDRPKAEYGMRKIYEAAGLPTPKFVLWFTSPAIGMLAINALNSINWLKGNQLGSQLYSQLRSQLDNQLRSQYVPTSFWGQWDAYWIARYEFARKIGVNYDDASNEALDGYVALAQSAGWWWPHQDVCIMTDRPTLIKRDSQGRLHNKYGPALQYSDGYGLWAWNGTRVSQNVIDDDPETWTAEQVLGEENTEVRRVMFERIGWDRVVNNFELKQVGNTADDPGNPGQSITLYDLPENVLNVDVRVLLCTNGSEERDGTRRRFGLTVPSEIGSPLEAQSWMATDPNHPLICQANHYAHLARRC